MTTTPKPNGGPAFPHPEPRDPQFSVVCSGMTLRDWFAGQALAGYLAKDFDIEEDPRWTVGRLCYAYADAMIAAREGK